MAGILEAVKLSPYGPCCRSKEVEAFKRNRLGPFYKSTLPYHETATDASLMMLGLELDKQEVMNDSETLHSIVKDDIGKFKWSLGGCYSCPIWVRKDIHNH